MPARVRVSKPSETGIQRACLALLRLLGATAIRVNGGAMAGEHRGKCRFVRFTDTPGCSDLLACFQGRFLALEIKLLGGRLRPAQSLFLDAVRQAGGVGAVIHSLDELRELLRREFLLEV